MQRLAWVASQTVPDHAWCEPTSLSSSASSDPSKEKPNRHCGGWAFEFIPGDDLLSHKVTLAVPSALEVLTAVFGMGTGVAPPLVVTGKLV